MAVLPRGKPHPDEIEDGQGGTLASSIGTELDSAGFCETRSIQPGGFSLKTRAYKGRVRSPPTTFRPQAEKYRAVNILSLNGETQRGAQAPRILSRMIHKDFKKGGLKAHLTCRMHRSTPTGRVGFRPPLQVRRDRRPGLSEQSPSLRAVWSAHGRGVTSPCPGAIRCVAPGRSGWFRRPRSC